MNGERRATVLIVDDDEDIVAVLRFVLESDGYGVVTAGDGRAGLDAVAARRPDLIVLDMKMPVMDGAAFVAELRRRETAPPPIVVVTAADDARKRARDVDAAGWLAKPFDMVDLQRAVAAQVSRSEA